MVFTFSLHLHQDEHSLSPVIASFTSLIVTDVAYIFTRKQFREHIVPNLKSNPSMQYVHVMAFLKRHIVTSSQLLMAFGSALCSTLTHAAF
jgi:hypothetical protein